MYDLTNFTEIRNHAACGLEDLVQEKLVESEELWLHKTTFTIQVKVSSPGPLPRGSSRLLCRWMLDPSSVERVEDTLKGILEGNTL